MELNKGITKKGIQIKKRARYWTLDRVRSCASKYKSRSEFKFKNPKAYDAALTHGYINEVCSHMLGRPNLETRFWAKVKKTKGCWLWTGGKFQSGYGQFKYKTESVPKPKFKPRKAHRISWELTRGLIPENKVVDHICRNRPCVNPNHLRIVTKKVNALENSLGPSAINHSKTHCNNGHEFNSENTYLYGKNKRQCRICQKKNTFNYSMRKKCK